MKKFFLPAQEVQNALNVYVRRLFPDHFKEKNIHEDPIGISYDNKGGKVTAAVTLRWQRKSDYKDGQHTALFEYREKRTLNGREYYWYCTSGLPGD